MMHYSFQPRNRILVSGSEFLAFAKKMGKNICENITKHLSGKSSQKLDPANQSGTDAFKIFSKRVI